MKLFKLVVATAFVVTLISCEKDDKTSPSTTSSSTTSTTATDCQNDPSKRRGARCKDGTESTATGSGACSSHGGVD